MLDAIPSNISVLNQAGTIVSVNKRWRDFATENGLELSNFGLGCNYFDYIKCDLSEAESEVREIIQGMRSVLEGQVDVFEHEYPCHNRETKQWFLMTVSCFEVDGKRQVLVAHQNITDRKQSELLAQSREQKLRSIYDSSSDAIILLSENRIIDCNAKAMQMFGIKSFEEFQEIQVADLSPKFQPDGTESQIRARNNFRRAYEIGEARFEWVHRSLNGDLFPAEVLLTCFVYQGEKVLQATVRDITHRKEYDEALRRSREDLNTAQRIAHVGSWYWDLESDHIAWSDQLFEMYGCDPKWPPPQFWEQQSLFATDSFQRMNIAIESTLQNGLPFELELEMTAHESGAKWIWFCGEVVRDSTGLRVGMRGIAQDITDRKKAEEARNEALGRLEKLSSRLPGAVYQFRLRPDGTSCFPYASERMRDIHGFGPEDVCDDATKAMAMHHPDDSADLMESILQSAQDLSPLTREFRLLMPDGSVRWLSANSIPEREADGSVLFHGYIADVTERIQAQQSLVAAHAAAHAANRAKSEFLANMSHEIRTPMTAILGYADILAEEAKNSLTAAARAECIDTIKRNGEHLLSIINDILDISKIEAAKLTTEEIEVSPFEILQDVIELMKVKAQAKGLYLQTKIESPIPATIRTDPTRLRQILVNLVGNAIKFTELGGVTISVRLDISSTPRICFDVIDTGIGISEQSISRLFQSFEQADASTTRKFGGTGLGLRISKRLAEILGGDILVSSKPGEGSVFSTSISTGDLDGIALVREPSARASIRLEQTNGHQLGSRSNASMLAGLRILLAEDGPDNQRLISFHLTKAGAIVEIADNGKIAVEKLSVGGDVEGELYSPPPFDLVLMDMQMPEMDGYEATENLRKQGCRLPILALTAHAMDIDLDKCLESGCDHRLTKPIDKSALLNACLEWGKKTGWNSDFAPLPSIEPLSQSLLIPSGTSARP